MSDNPTAVTAMPRLTAVQTLAEDRAAWATRIEQGRMNPDAWADFHAHRQLVDLVVAPLRSLEDALACAPRHARGWWRQTPPVDPAGVLL